jgi:hypothetical protein
VLLRLAAGVLNLVLVFALGRFVGHISNPINNLAAHLPGLRAVERLPNLRVSSEFPGNPAK